MTLLDDRPADHTLEPAAGETWLVRRLGPAWPLKLLLLGFPVWWALGLASFIGLIMAGAMAVQMARRGTVRVPVGFGLWVLFLIWMVAGVFVLWAHAPGTIDGGSPTRLIPFAYRVLWYLAITIAMLYPMNVTPRGMPGMQVARWLGTLFVYCVIGGLAGVLWPHFAFTSPLEMVLPGARTNDFLNALVHPELTTSSDFLGYVQPRPKAPFAYPNAWGNNLGLLLPFFVYSMWADGRRWRRVLVPIVLGLGAIPVAYSLNRGLWIGIGVMTVAGMVALARSRHYTALWVMLSALGLAAVLVVLSPLWATITLRVATPHSNERRLTVAEVVTSTTWQGSPLLGYGSTRKVEGSFASIAGGDNPNCRQCAAPPLGTQGFMWRLVFTTGFVGTILFVSFLGVQFLVHFRRRDPYSILGCITLVTSGLFFFVYDSLETPLFILMLAVGLMNRERIVTDGATLAERAAAALPPPPAGPGR